VNHERLTPGQVHMLDLIRKRSAETGFEWVRPSQIIFDHLRDRMPREMVETDPAGTVRLTQLARAVLAAREWL
jgi:hypothetical protein